MGSGFVFVYIVLNHCQEYNSNAFINLCTYFEKITNIILHNKKLENSHNFIAN